MVLATVLTGRPLFVAAIFLRLLLCRCCCAVVLCCLATHVRSRAGTLLKAHTRMAEAPPSVAGEGSDTTPVPPEPVGEVDAKTKAMLLKVEGNEALKQRAYDIAMQKYSEAIELYEDATFYCNRAYVSILTKQFEDAVLDATRAIALKPDYWRAFVRKVQALAHLKQHSGVVATVRQVGGLVGCMCCALCFACALCAALALSHRNGCCLCHVWRGTGGGDSERR